jgi:hypothetical protein
MHTPPAGEAPVSLGGQEAPNPQGSLHHIPQEMWADPLPAPKTQHSGLYNQNGHSTRTGSTN